MNGIIALFALLGMVATGYLLSLILVPLVIYSLNLIVYTFAVLTKMYIMNKPPKLTDEPINDSNNSKPEVNIENKIHKTRNFSPYKDVVSGIPRIHYLNKRSNGGGNKDVFNMPYKPIATQFNQVLNIIHNGIIKRLSTKCKQNLYFTRGFW